jgi:myo-inositol-1(or 4)-monophosphatase
LADLLAFARAVAAEAGALLKAGAGRAHHAGEKRAPTDLVTEYDRRSEALLVERVRAAFPDDRIVAEEGGELAGGSSRRWLIDPLDGTTNFAHGLPFFCVSVGVEEAGALSVGVVEAPALGWSFWAARGRGAWLNDRRLQVSQTDRLARALLATGFPYDAATHPQNNFAEFVSLYQLTHGVRRVGAAALDLAMVAAGWLDGYWEMRLKPWDLAAGALLVGEAGGRVSAWSGAPFSVDSGEVVASNARIHDQLVAALGAVAGPPQRPAAL